MVKIEADEKPVSELFCRKAYEELKEETNDLMATCRTDIIAARIKLVGQGITEAQQKDLWSVVDCREWFLKIFARDFDEELEKIDRGLEAELSR